jgi:hypothetical protein
VRGLAWMLVLASSSAQAQSLTRDPVLVLAQDLRQAKPANIPNPVRVPVKLVPDDTACAGREPPCPARMGHAVSPDGSFEVTLREDRVTGTLGTVITIEGHWKKPAWVRTAIVELPFEGDRATVVGRDLKPVAAPVAILERFDPKWVLIERAGKPVATALVDDGLDGVEVRAGAGGVTLRLELDAAEARPFVHDERCTSNWKDPNKHLPAPVRQRLADEKVLARVQLITGKGLSLVKARFPDGRRAALTFTDHADQSSARTFDVLTTAFLRHKLVLTKALFAKGSDRPQLEDPKVSALADQLHAGGSEIIPHSATPKRDERPVTEAALVRFARWKARTWIDHQPETNCEAFGDQGFRVGGRFGISDLLVAHRYDYVWAEVDARPDEFNLLMPRQPGRRAPTVWPVGRLDVGAPDSLWMFRSVWAFLEAKRFYGMYAPARLDRLEAERGLHVSHTYLETYHPRRTIFGLKNLLVPAEKKGVPGGPGPVKLDPRFELLLTELEARQERGSLWVPTLAVLGDRMRLVSEVQVLIGADGNAILRTARPVPGATFLAHEGKLNVSIGGRVPRGLRSDGKTTEFWDDLPAGDTPLVLSSADGSPRPLFKAE